MIILALGIGISMGALSFFLLYVGLCLAKRATAYSNLGHAGSLMLGVLGSFLVLGIGLVLCAVLARDMLVYAGMSAALSLVTAALLFGLRKLFVRK